MMMMLVVVCGQIEGLEASGCSSEDWQEVMVIGEEPLAVKMIRNCTFQGRVEIGVVEGSKVGSGLRGGRL